MLDVENLSCGYNGTPVLRGISFKARPNEKLFIIGPNGCGKTTLLRAVAGLIPFAGSVHIDGHPAADMKKKELARKIAMLSQISSVYFAYTVYETVMQGRYAHTKSGVFRSETKADRDMVAECLKSTDIWPLRDKSVRQLSGGQLQRVFLARALAQEPGIILLDEPTNHLDLRYQLELMEYLGKWVKEPGRIVIGVIHDINLALSYSDRLMLIRNGEIFAEGPSGKLELSLIDETFEVKVRDHMVNTLRKWE